MSRAPRVLAVSSGGGHWLELLRLAPAFEGCDLAYATVSRVYRKDVPGKRFFALVDATRWNKLRLVLLVLLTLAALVRFRPDVVVSTGAAPGYFAVRFGKLLGARTVWIDSFANIEELSMSGRIVGPFADLWLTQWPHLAAPGGPSFAGSVF